MLSVSVDAAVRGRLSRAELSRLRARLSRMLRAAGLVEQSPEPLEASLRLVDDATIHALNRDYRHKDRPTDVLAFAMREGPGGDLHPHILGDIVISLDTAARQRKRKPLYDEVLFLATHGLCHLLGYDHQTDAQEAEMSSRMQALLAEAGRTGRTRPA